MRIAYIAAGAGGMFCGSCIRDNALASELQRMGHEAFLVPIYTPLRTDEHNVAIDRVFYGAINVYLQQKATFFGRLPTWMRHWLDSPALLRRIPTSSATDAAELGALTLSMLEGEHGRQQVELEELVDFLRDDLKPEVVQLTNSMLLGFVDRLRAELPGAALVCALQGEDLFIDGLPDSWRRRVLEQMRRQARHCDLFLATSQFYAESMAELLELPPERVLSAGLGINLDGFGTRSGEPGGAAKNVGYLARISPEKGLHQLAAAFRLLCEDRPPGSLRLRVAGYLGARDRPYYRQIVADLERWGLSGHVDLLGEVDHARKIEMLDSLHVFSVPTPYKEPKGLPVLEAMASGVPVVQPDHGAFPELIGATGGGVLVTPGDPEALARGIGSLLDDDEERRRLGERARTETHRQFGVEAMARATLDAYQRLRTAA